MYIAGTAQMHHHIKQTGLEFKLITTSSNKEINVDEFTTLSTSDMASFNLQMFRASGFIVKFIKPQKKNTVTIPWFHFHYLHHHHQSQNYQDAHVQVSRDLSSDNQS